MTKQSELIPSSLDVRTLWGINPESLGYAERAYRTWCETAGDIQSRATQFLNNRFQKDYEAIAQLGQCKTPVEMFTAQVDYASKAFADLVDEGRQVVAYLSNMATQGIFNGPVAQLASVSKSKVTGRNGRSHRVSGH